MFLKLAFNPHFFLKDINSLVSSIVLILQCVFFSIFCLLHPDNGYIMNIIATPFHIVPEWYYLAIYAILKQIPHKSSGFVTFMLVFLYIVFLSDSDLSTARLVSTMLRSHSVWILTICPYIWLIWLGAAMPGNALISIGRLISFMHILLFLISAHSSIFSQETCVYHRKPNLNPESLLF